MPELVLHPKAAPTGQIWVWIGVFEADSPPTNLSWKLDGAAATALPIRPLSPVHAHGSRSYTGVYSLAVPTSAGVRYEVEASASGTGLCKLEVRSSLSTVPKEDWLRILLMSCYHSAEDRKMQAARTFRNIRKTEYPDLTFLMGDQVYLDLPTISDFPDDEAKLARKFEKYYVKNWGRNGNLSKILDAAPSISCPDDHEYWNNFPHSSPFIQNSWSPESRERWKNAADQSYDAFQLSPPAQRGDCVEIDIGLFSAIILDQRSQRMEDRSATMTPAGLKQLEKWVDRLIENEQYGAVVTGQSLLDKPVGDFKGKVADRMLSNYEDYETIVKLIEKLAKAGRPVLLLTGDVHWGRVTSVLNEGRLMFYEIICSPSSLVTTVGADQLKTIGAGIRAFFGGQSDRWPRHSMAPKPERFFAHQVFGKTYNTEVLYKQPGNQLATLALRQAAGTLEAKVTYFEIHKSPKQPVEISLGLLRDRA